MNIVDLDKYIDERVKDVFPDIQYRYSYSSNAYMYYEYLLFDELNVDIIIDKNIKSKRIIDILIDENIERIKGNLKELLLKIDRVLLNEIL